MLAQCLSVVIKYVLVILATALTVLYFIITRNYDYWKKRGVPYEKPFLIFGNIKFIMRKSFWDYFYETWQNYPVPYVGIFLGHKPALVIQDPELARRIIVKDHAYFEDRQLYSGPNDPIGNLNLFIVKNPLWSEMRNQLTPMFKSSKLRSLANLMNLNSQYLGNRIGRLIEQGNDTPCLKDIFSRYTTDTVGYTVFGLRTSALNDDDTNPLWLITCNMVKWTFWRGFEFTATFFVPALAKILGTKFFSQAATEHIRNTFYAVLNEKQRRNDENDLIQRWLKIKENIKALHGKNAEFSDNLILAQAAIFILGAIETSTATLSYFMHEISHNPDAQEKLQKEIDDAYSKTDNEMLCFEELLELKYLNQCIQETLRMHTPVPFLDRVCRKSYKVNDTLTIEKGTAVYVNCLALHYNENHYPDPQTWKPERFTGISPDIDTRDYTFLPFGDGPRFCIGKRYGMLQIRIAIVHILRKYRVEPLLPKKIDNDPYSVVLSPGHDAIVRFVPRD